MQLFFLKVKTILLLDHTFISKPPEIILLGVFSFGELNCTDGNLIASWNVHRFEFMQILIQLIGISKSHKIMYWNFSYKFCLVHASAFLPFGHITIEPSNILVYFQNQCKCKFRILSKITGTRWLVIIALL